MIVSGYDIGPFASAAVHIAGGGYTPSFSNSFKAHMKEPAHMGMTMGMGMSMGMGMGASRGSNVGINTGSRSLHTTPHGDIHYHNAASFDTGKIKNMTGNRNSQKIPRDEISGVRLIKCFEFDIMRVTRSHRSSNCCRSGNRGERRRKNLLYEGQEKMEEFVPIGRNRHFGADSLPSSTVIITPARAVGVATLTDMGHDGNADGDNDDDDSDDDVICLDTPQGVFLYSPNFHCNEGNQLENENKRRNDCVKEREEEGDGDSDGEDDEQDNWRDRDSEEEGEEGEEEDRGEQVEEEEVEVIKSGRGGSAFDARDGPNGTKKSGEKVIIDDLKTSIPVLGSMLKLLTPSTDGISIGR